MLNFRTDARMSPPVSAPITKTETPSISPKTKSNLSGITSNSIQSVDKASYSAFIASMKFPKLPDTPISQGSTNIESFECRNLPLSDIPENSFIQPNLTDSMKNLELDDSMDFLVGPEKTTVESSTVSKESNITDETEGKLITESHVKFAKYAEFSPFEKQGEGEGLLFKPSDFSTGIVKADRQEMNDMKKELNEAFVKLGFQHGKNGMFYNEKTGTNFFVVINEGKPAEISLCFGGIGTESYISDRAVHSKMFSNAVKSAISDFLGFVPPAAKEAMKIGAALKEVAGNNNATIIGHSHGGGLAQCAAKASGLNAVIFNARPLGAGVRAELEKNHKDTKPDITSFVTDGDWVAAKKGLLDKIASRLSPLTKSKRPASIATTIHEIKKKDKEEVLSSNRDIKESGMVRKILISQARHGSYSEEINDERSKQNRLIELQKMANS